MPRTKRLHQLKRPNIRQDWSKWNLYNMSRVQTPQATHKTFFQQKWSAKSMLRAYHNPDVREGTWTRLFDRRLPAVVPMDHTYLARTDGSDMAGGRGMGVEQMPEPPGPTKLDRFGRPRVFRTAPPRTPYMHMTFHPLERRLDTAIFRALFASSTRQARQFVTHGWVKVNGKKMIYPSYQLNPGDMFSVDTERVMFATGAPKVPEAVSENESKESTEEDASAEETADAVEAAAAAESGAAAAENFPQSAAAAKMEAIVATVDSKDAAKKALQKLMTTTRKILEQSKTDLSGKRQRELRTLGQSVKKLLAKYRGVEESELDISVADLQTTLTTILAKVPEEKAQEPTISSAVNEIKQNDKPAATSDAPEPEDYQAKKDARLLAEALERIRENPYDPEKPYATPWRPRDYMSAFAFIPRYLEVNQNICSAVYLRHPVARPGLAEVPTPYGAETMALGFNWYLRRR